MALFRRTRETAAIPPPPDRDLTCFDVEQAARFRLVVRGVLAQLGADAVVATDYVIDSRQRRYELGALAVACSQAAAGEPAWPALVREHLAPQVEPGSTGSDTSDQG